ncbi:MAG: hypothetical protein CMI30_07285 [Opitutae bacterium]|nr:hypothetical protein [Opitutae bacterium]
MKITQYLSTTTFLFLCLLGLVPGMAFAQADGAQKRSPELQVLDRLVGVWDVKTTIKPVGAEEMTATSVSRRSWTLGGTFVQFQDTEHSHPQAPEFQLLWTYDPVAKNYPAVLMDGPHWASLTGVWNEETKIMHWTGKMSNGVTGEGQHRFIGKDRSEASGVFRNPEGEIVMETSWSHTRRKAKSPKK